MEGLLCVTKHFLLACFHEFSLSFKSLTMFLGVSLFEFILTQNHNILGCLYLYHSSNLGCYSHYFFKYSLCPFIIFFFFSYCHSAYVGPLDGAPIFFRLCTLFFNLYYPCSSDLIISLDSSSSSLTLSFAEIYL